MKKHMCINKRIRTLKQGQKPQTCLLLVGIQTEPQPQQTLGKLLLLLFRKAETEPAQPSPAEPSPAKPARSCCSSSSVPVLHSHRHLSVRLLVALACVGFDVTPKKVRGVGLTNTQKNAKLLCFSVDAGCLVPQLKKMTT